jgi:hypothetical protein
MTDMPLQPPVVAPMPMQFQVAQAPSPNGGVTVILIVSTPYGQHHFPIDGQTAKAVGRQLLEAGSAAKAGLVLAK